MAERKREESGLPALYWNPFAIVRELERAFDNMGIGNLMPSSVKMPMVDIRDDGTHYLIEADLPGMTKEDVEMEVSDDTLLLKARKERAEEEKGEGYIRRERGISSYHRRIALPEDADPDCISARINNGVLTVTVPKREGVSGRRKVEIE